MMKCPEEINVIWKDIEGLLEVVKKVYPKNQPEVISLYQSLNVAAINFSSTIENARKRQLLIDKQCSLHQFGGVLHEEYHRVNIELDTNLNNLFASLKTTLNRLSSLLYEIIPHSERSGIAGGSFGRMLNSLEKKKLMNKELEKLKNTILMTGKKIDLNINNYRDDYIEHVRKPTNGTLYSTATSLTRIHTPVKVNDIKDKASTILEKTEEVLYIKLKSKNGEYKYYLHVERTADIGRGVEKGSVIGTLSDGGTGHFEKYGSHSHIFSSPKATVNLNNGEIVSPELYDTLEMISVYFQEVLKECSVLAIIKTSGR